jgi:hypothetical protein
MQYVKYFTNYPYLKMSYMFRRVCAILRATMTERKRKVETVQWECTNIGVNVMLLTYALLKVLQHIVIYYACIRIHSFVTSSP